MLFDRDGVPMLAVYTSWQRVGSVASYAMTMTGEQVLSRMPPGVGLVVNPGHAEGFEMPPEGIVKMRADLGSAPQRPAPPE
ncbi:SseB family protein [Cellulomonas soli]